MGGSRMGVSSMDEDFRQVPAAANPLAAFAASGKLRLPTAGGPVPRPHGVVRQECDGGELVSGMRDEESH